MPERADLWGPDGVFAQSFAGYQPRAQQRQMYREVAQALVEEKHALIEAGTGTGKSLAYLTPLILLASRRNVQVGVSTNTINLQDQLINKDIPDAVKALDQAGLIDGNAFTYRALKGRSNYLCEQNRVALEDDTGDWPEAESALRKVAEWKTATGDRVELNLTQDELWPWRLMSCQYNRGCEAYENGSTQCSLNRARLAAMNANLVVVNHALLLNDVAANDPYLGQVTHWVIDEGHRLEEEASNAFGLEIVREDLEKRLQDSQTDTAVAVTAHQTETAWRALWDRLTVWLLDHRNERTTCKQQR